MTEDSEVTGKTVRTSLQSLSINVTNDELKYRNKYLPDPRRLSDDKIVCTVCSASLASRVRKGKSIYIHPILGVLVCKHCRNFYGDGIFSTDEDGDDKYCRWCGQGGTLYLCSKCNCGFCKKCMTKNMKNSALEAIEGDDWKCLICIPRPIFGSRAVCWASQELNNSERKSQFLKQRLEEEKLKLENGKECIKSEEELVKKDGRAKKRIHDSEDSDSSTVHIPPKKLKEDVKTNKSLNGSVKKHRRKVKESPSDSEMSNSDSSSKWEKRKRKKNNKRKIVSSDESSSTSRTKRKKSTSKKKSKTSSDESSDSDKGSTKSKSLKNSENKSSKYKRKKKKSKKSYDRTSDSPSSEPSEKRKKKSRSNKNKSSSETSSEENESRTNDEEKQNNFLEKSPVKESGCPEESDASGNGVTKNAVKAESSIFSNSNASEKELENQKPITKENQAYEKTEFENGSKTSNIEKLTTQNPESEGELQTPQNLVQSAVCEELQPSQVFPPGNDDEYTLSYHESSPDFSEQLSQEDEVTVKVHLAIEWLESVSNDIADLGNLIAARTIKFGERKVSLESLHSYDDVLLTLEKLKRLLGGIHTNYKQIEDNLEDKLKSWKILTGLENPEVEEPLLDVEEGEMLVEDEELNGSEVLEEGDVDTEMDSSKLHNESPKSEGKENVEINPPHIDDFVLQKADEAQSVEPEKELENVYDKIEVNISIKDEDITDTLSTNHDVLEKEIESEKAENEPDITDSKITAQDVLEIENESEKVENGPLQFDEPLLEEAVKGSEEIIEDIASENIDNAIIEAQLHLKSGGNLVWSGLLSSDEDSNLSYDDQLIQKQNNNDTKLADGDNLEAGSTLIIERNSDNLAENKTFGNQKDLSCGDSETLQGREGPSKEDTENFEALQELLCSSSEPDIGSSESDSDSSDELELDDSDLDAILKPRKVIKRSSKQKEPKVREENLESSEDKGGEDKEAVKEGELWKETEPENKAEEPEDSEAEIDMLTDLSKLKKKTILRRVEQEESSSDESSSEESQENDGTEDNVKEKKRRKKYNTEVKKKREQERNELFGFLEGESSAEDEADMTKQDLDVMEERYASESSDSMSLEAFSRKMNDKWRELEKEQDQLNLQMLLASDSEPGSGVGDDIVLESDEDKKKKKGKKIKEEKMNEDEDCVENIKEEETEGKVKEENEGADDEEYEQFVEDMTKNRTTFTGLGSSSEEDRGEEEIDIKEEPLSDQEGKVKKEPRGSDKETSSNSDSSTDLFLDLTKKKCEKKTGWRQHKLLRMKLSDTDTSDEERWWQRRLEKEKKKKKEGGDSDSSEFDEFAMAISPKKSHGREKKEDGSDKENKKVKTSKPKGGEDVEEVDSSSTLEMSSTDSSGSEVFKKKKKKKKESSDSDVLILSDTDKKKKKKKKRTNLSGDSSDESEGSDDDVIDITQKSSQGESPGKGGRKNIRKVLTKHELAAATKAAAKEEEERKRRIAARQKLFNEMFEIKEAEVLEKLVLDFDPETKTELISVDKDLVTKMKPHQAKGVKFMWDSCFESISQLKTKKGSGCILAHCMGLGKTFQVVSLVHTILTHTDTDVRTVLVVCPLSTVLNWFNEFDKWLEDVAGGRNIKIYHLTKYKKAHERSRQLNLWHRTGGVMILGYEMFRILANPVSKKFRLMHTEVFQKTLIDPGADLVVCDEGHMLKNESTLLSKAMSRIRTLRRIVLTGTPMQNNLKEYHCMVQFVKPNLLGTRREFLNQFVNPITNGQFVDSTEADVKVMKRRAHVLHKMLEGLVQRFDYSVLTPFLPPKHEYVISLRLSDVQVKLYQLYLEYFCQKSDDKRTSSQLFQDWQVLGRIWTHPLVLKMSTDKAEKEKPESTDSEGDQRQLRSQKRISDFFKKKRKSSSAESSKQDSEVEGSIKDFINDKSSSSSLSLSSSSDDDDEEKKARKQKRKEKKASKDDKEIKKKESAEKIILAAEPVDEINLISSEEEDKDKTEVEVVEENKNADAEESGHKGDDSGIEDPDKKTDNKLNTEDEKSENPDTEDGEKDDKDEKIENKEEKTEKEKKTEPEHQFDRRGGWWKDIVEPQHLEDINQSAKLILLFAILRECEMIEDKVLVFSQSLFSLDLIEYFLAKVDRATEENRLDESLGNHAGCWQKGLDYFRLDGSSSSESRSAWCKSFNKEDNPRARLFLISTRAGGLGINLTGANRVVIFDASWNPSHDIQSIFRIYRFGQKKPCYVYRFVAHGTMEEKVYDRQVAKQLLSSRVVDEQQVHRHFSMSDLNELYTFTPPQERTERPTPALPRDRLMAELLTQYSDWIEKYHEHDSLLENIADEELNEEERKLAWEDYENEKKRGFSTPAPGGVPNFPGVANQIELFRKSLRLKFPNSTEAEMTAMLNTLMYQVNYRAMSQQVGTQQMGHAGPSQQPQTFRTVSSNNMGSSQPFTQMVKNIQQNIQQRTNQMNQQRMGNITTNQQRMGNITTNQQRMGNATANLQRMGNITTNQQRMGNGPTNQQMIGNGQIRKTNKTSQEIYMEQMRKQQEANLARIQSQKRMQQLQANRPVQKDPVVIRPVNKVTMQRGGTSRQATPQPAPSQFLNQRGQTMWKTTQPAITPSRVQKIQNQRTKAVEILNAPKPLQVTPFNNHLKPGARNVQQPSWQTPKQKRQEEMQQRIKAMQQQTANLQNKVDNRLQKLSSMDPEQQRRLEEMKKRYNASRKKANNAASNSPISIVEIDDEPGP